MLKKMLFTLPPERHGAGSIKSALREHPEVRFVSLVGMDNFGRDTDEKIPVAELLSDVEGFLKRGVQTDGSAVFLPGIADISNARVDLRPDMSVNWYVDYNFDYLEEESGLPVGTLRIPAYLVHNGAEFVGSRSILKSAENFFKKELLNALEHNPYIFEHLPFKSASEIKEIELTTATEMEFYVKTPREAADRERLHVSQELKEQYWKRTVGPVRTALEDSIEVLNQYGFNVEMGHKEVGGVKAELGAGGYDHIMEQLEIDWKYSSPMQTADNDRHARYVITDIFRYHGLDVSFLAKPVEGVAGSGKHTHFGVTATLMDGRKVNLFAALDQTKDYMSPVGFGALLGLLKNYEIVNPFANATNDAFSRLKPGYEAPVSVCVSLGASVETASRNRTVLIGLIRDLHNPMAAHFELRSPNPRSNTYLVMAAGFTAMADGIRASLNAGKTSSELTASVSKKYGEEDFYLEKNRIYRAENDIFADYTPAERAEYFGRSPMTVRESVASFDKFPKKTGMLLRSGIMTGIELKSFMTAVTEQWAMELKDRIIPELRSETRRMTKLHGEGSGNSLDEMRWKKIEDLKFSLFKDSSGNESIVTLLSRALARGDFDAASELQLIAGKKMEILRSLYSEYERNII